MTAEPNSPIAKRLVDCSIYTIPSQELLNHLATRNQEGAANLLLPTRFVSKEGGLLGEALHNLILAPYCKKKERLITFFNCSHLESLHGAIKIIRHKTTSSLPLLVYDPYSQYADHLNPAGYANQDALVPGVIFDPSLEAVLKAILTSSQAFSGVLLLTTALDNPSLIDRVLIACQQHALPSGLSEAYHENWYCTGLKQAYSVLPDVFLFGENLTRHEMPFGCFSMTRALYQPWNRIDTCMTHSSTFSGNTVTLSFILSLLAQSERLPPPAYPNGRAKSRCALYRRYVNPKMTLLLQKARLAVQPQRAHGCQLTIDNRVYFDGAGASGSAFRGHNPKDIPSILSRFDTEVDYWKAFSYKTTSLTGLEACFPAVSGSHAVETSLALGLIAGKGKKALLTFSGNYSGKTLGALNASRTPDYQNPFAPLYASCIELDPWKEGAEQHLIDVLEKNEIALVWFEMIQGDSLKTIPEEILVILSAYQRKQGLLVGVDEILSGMFRTGSFLYSQQTSLQPDLVSIGKGMSDMTFPCSAVLASASVVQAAKKVRPLFVEKLETAYINQLGAYISLHALRSFQDTIGAEHVQKMEALFRARLEPLIQKSPLFCELRGKGLLLYLKLNAQQFPVSLFGEFSIEFLMTSRYLQKSQVLLFNSRLTPALNVTEFEVKNACDQLSRVLKKETPFSLFILCLKFILLLAPTLTLQTIRKWKK